jgi:tetratricopeptide (TPR) repeat protein
MYAWRCGLPGAGPACPPEFRQKSDALQQALLKETDFAFKQAFAFCPYSPEAVFRYANFLLGQGRFDDTILIFETCLKLDPFNDQARDQLNRIRQYKEENAQRSKAMGQLDQMEKTAQTDPNNTSNLVMLGGVMMQMQQTNRAIQLFNQALDNTNLKQPEAAAIVQYFGTMANLPGFEKALRKVVVLAPDQPEYRFNLADVEALTGRTTDALADLKLALDLNAKRLQANPSAVNLLNIIQKDPNLNNLRSLPEFQKLVPNP